MAASGLAPDRQVRHLIVWSILPVSSLRSLSVSNCPSISVSSQASLDEWNHMSELVLFALAMQETLKEINRHSAKNFQLRVGKWLSGSPLTHINNGLLM